MLAEVTYNQVLRVGIDSTKLLGTIECPGVETRATTVLRYMLLSHNKWRRDGHDTGDPSCHGVDVHVLTFITKLHRGAAASLGVVAPVNSDLASPANAVGSIQAKVGHV